MVPLVQQGTGIVNTDETCQHITGRAENRSDAGAGHRYIAVHAAIGQAREALLHIHDRYR